ncbi:hypothetical protein [Paenibacillus sp. NFR01]|uniref:hypothetical protein n=1 Tax=Paenibacillus sp. NFR01 TaxID=1566279 RepID=UPI0008C38F60|nr:hypothetical protein [Paenibacillus sp. NFR01]SEU23201.1 hypothetical protein SAMN03159358_4167 [Paenibacillus sp. NFR01]
MGNSAKIRHQAKRLQGRKVVITLHDGRTYVGWISGLKEEGLVLTRPHYGKRRTRSRSGKPDASVSGLFSLLGAGGGLGGIGALGGAFRFFGFMQRAMPVMKMGWGMIKTIKPFMSGLKGLMGPNNQQ